MRGLGWSIIVMLKADCVDDGLHRREATFSDYRNALGHHEVSYDSNEPV
eukprot:CAMPEP_0184724760 /NCGR_PEP_ID=MMETSP0314-20130426/28899_1 /TAXON_ID=38298 /ORGANISM="Rhodella maculata, Strain CCMP 736" /LENGTH=48 /DNA_ID= /DNA_START= /DNA_END= /DNA_ORIENTATION=